MSRTIKLEVVDYAQVVAGRDYLIRVIEVKSKRKTLMVRFCHVSEEQQGREHAQSFPLPVRPSGLTADLFRACGKEVNIGATLKPRELIGKCVNVKFRPSSDGVLEICSIDPISKEKNNEPSESESTGP